MQAANIPLGVLLRIASMAVGPRDSLAHDGAAITLLAAAGLRHKDSCGDIFAITLNSSAVVFVAIAWY